MLGSQPIYVDSSLFDPANIPAEVTAFNEMIMEKTKPFPRWWEVGAPKYRAMRDAGEAAFPAPKKLDHIKEISIPSRDAGRSIPASVYVPQSGTTKGVLMHIHGGGWVLGHHRMHDLQLQDMASTNNIAVVSIGYRLAPENPHPAAAHDCYDAVEWLVDHAPADLGAPLSFIGGESAGGHLTMLSALHLLQHPEARYADYKLKGLVLLYGIFDLSLTPSVSLFSKPTTLILDRASVDHFGAAFVPGVKGDALKEPALSPLYADLAKLRGRLPPGLYICGTEDCLLDDTVFMSAKWQMHGGPTEVMIIPGAFHGFTSFFGVTASQSGKAADRMKEFIGKSLA